jgi:fused signal recognition particle receptor
MGIFSFFSKEKKESLNKGLFVTKQSFFSKLANAIMGKATVDDEVLENLEEILITSDVGVDTSMKIIDRIKARVAKERKIETSKLNDILREEIAEMLVSNGMEDKADFSVTY